MTENLRGAALMTLAMVTFTVNDTCVKAASDALPLAQIIVLRGVSVSLLLVAVIAVSGVKLRQIAPRDRRLIAIRTLAEVTATWTFLTALIHMPIANLSAIMQALPLSVTLGSMLVFREAVGWRRMTAIAIGFLGVMLIVRPGMDGFTRYAVLGLLSVLAVTVRDLASRRLTPTVPSLAVSLAAAIAVTCLGLVMSFDAPWQAVGPRDGALIGGAVLMLMFGYAASVASMRVGEIGFVAPFRYTSLVAALVLGLVVFGDWPDGLTLAGAAIVVATGAFTLWRERGKRPAVMGLRVR